MSPSPNYQFYTEQALGIHGKDRFCMVPCYYCGLKIMELKNCFTVTFSALGIHLQKFTIFPLRFLTL